MAVEKSIEELCEGVYQALVAVDALADVLSASDSVRGSCEDRFSQLAFVIRQLVERALGEASEAAFRLRMQRLELEAAVVASGA